ncbi:MAG: cytochrome c oxidase assembly protein [Acidimicrobiales bacterium]
MAETGARASRWLVAGGLASAVVAIGPPLDGAAEHSLTAHMAQHVVLMVVAAPLVAAGARAPQLVAARDRHWATWALGSLVVQAVVMWAWHAPVPYDAALSHEPLHAVEHLSYLVTAAAFWWCVGVGSPRPRGAAVPVVFVAALPGSALGAALTLAGHPWYRAYPTMADQQLAGVVMWGFGGLAYVLVAAVLFGLWVRSLEADTPGRPLLSGVPS